MKRKIDDILQLTFSLTDNRKWLKYIASSVSNLYSKALGNELLWKHNRNISNKILLLCTIKDLVNAGFVCKHWNQYIIKYMKHKYRSNIPIISQISKPSEYLFHFIGVGGQSWIPNGNGQYIIANTRATFTLCSLKPEILVFYGISRKTTPRLIRLDMYEIYTVHLKSLVSEWRKSTNSNDCISLYIEATYRHMKHCIRIPVIVPNANTGYKRAQRAKKNNKIIF